MRKSNDMLRTYIDMLKDPEESFRREGAFQLGEMMDEDAIPFLINTLRDKSKGVQEIASDSLIKIGGEKAIREIIPLLKEEDVPLRNMGIDILGKIGGDAPHLLFPLLKDEDEDLHIYTADILGKIGDQAALEPLKELIMHPNANVRNAAVISLGLLGNPNAVDSLIIALKDEEWIKFSAIEALARIGDNRVIEPLISALDQNDDLIRAMIIETLGELRDKKAVEPLLSKIKDVPVEIRNNILKALIDIAGNEGLISLVNNEREQLLNYFLDALQDRTPTIQECAIKELGLLRDDIAIWPLIELAQKLEEEDQRLYLIEEALVNIGSARALFSFFDENDSINMMLARILGKVGGKEAVRILIEIWPIKSLEVQRAIIESLCEIGDSDAVDFIVSSLKHEDGHIRASSAIALGKLKSEKTIPHLASLLSDDYPDVKECAFNSLLSIGGEKVHDTFIEGIKSNKITVREFSIMGLGHMKTPHLSDILIPFLSDKDWEIRKASIIALSHISNSNIVKLLLPLLKDENTEVRLALVKTIGETGGREVVEALLSCLEDYDMGVRYHAINSLGKIRDKRATGYLIDILEKEEGLLKVAAIRELGNIGDKKALGFLSRLYDQQEDPTILEVVFEAIEKIEMRP
ncbi:MAG: HEAT repeat domain-containing protein [Thermodesulfobacteriota bacterium]|nr:HEAT repeat domain-containing protein [Thermodesulfobacteriota bacterium]